MARNSGDQMRFSNRSQMQCRRNSFISARVYSHIVIFPIGVRMQAGSASLLGIPIAELYLLGIGS